MNWNMDEQRIFEILFLVIIIGAIARKSGDVDAAITSLAPQVYSFTSLLQGGTG